MDVWSYEKRLKNIFICEQLGIVSVEDKMRENCLTWYAHVLGRTMDVVVQSGEMIIVSGTKRGGGRPKKTLIETINNDLSTLNLTKHMAFYRSQ